MRSRRAGAGRPQLQRRLAAVAGGWVPTPDLVERELQEGPAPGSESPVTGVGWDDVPARRPVRQVERAALPGVALLAAGAVLGAGVLWLLAWPRGDAVPSLVASVTSAPAAGSAPSRSPAATPTGTPVVVDVAGAVHRPGVLELPAGSRVVDAIDAAGGVLRHGDTTSLNLARVLSDGEQVLVPAAASGAATSPLPTGGSGVVHLNSADLEQLDSLPGIGPVLAQRILDYRTSHGPFSSVDQLREVSGIGDATFADLEPLVAL